MRISLLTFAFFFVFFSKAQTPWVGNNAVWKYYCVELTFGIETIYMVHKSRDTLLNGKLCDELITTNNYYDSSNDTLVQIAILDTNYTYLSVTGDSVMYWQNGNFRTLFDFSRSVGDSILIHVSDGSVNSFCRDSSYSNVTSISTENYSGNPYRTYTVSFNTFDLFNQGELPISTSNRINERFGTVSNYTNSFLFPLINTWCIGTYEDYFFSFLCYEDDSIFFEWDCDYYKTLSIEKYPKNESIVFPNPNNGNFILEGTLKPNQTDADIVITDMNGKVVLQDVIRGNSFRKIISLNASTGIYLYSVKSENEVLQRGKIVIK